MSKTRIIIISVIAVVLICILCFLISAIVLTPKADKIKPDNSIESYFITNPSYIDYQEGNDCSAYAAAYVLRCLNKSVTGRELYPEMQRYFGMMTARSVVSVLEKQGCAAKAYHGNIATLKRRLNIGYPIICFIKNGGDTHYVVAVGYDKEYIYVVDSIKENSNVSENKLYNRKVEIGNFEALWKNNFYFVNNIYIAVE